MTQEEVDNIVKARSELIAFYSMLKGGSSPMTATVKQADVAMVIEVAVKHIDAALSRHVSFSSIKR